MRRATGKSTIGTKLSSSIIILFALFPIVFVLLLLLVFVKKILHKWITCTVDVALKRIFSVNTKWSKLLGAGSSLEHKGSRNLAPFFGVQAAEVVRME
jgi:hypothetical protein